MKGHTTAYTIDLTKQAVGYLPIAAHGRGFVTEVYSQKWEYGEEKQGVSELVLGDICIPFAEMLNAVRPLLAAEDRSGGVVTTSRVGQ